MRNLISKDNSRERFEKVLEANGVKFEDVPRKVTKRFLQENGMSSEVYRAKGSPFRVINELYPGRFNVEDFSYYCKKNNPHKWTDEAVVKYFNEQLEEYLEFNNIGLNDMKRDDFVSMCKKGKLPYIRKEVGYNFEKLIWSISPHLNGEQMFLKKKSLKKLSNDNKENYAMYKKVSDEEMTKILLNEIKLNKIESEQDILNFFSAKNLRCIREREGFSPKVNAFLWLSMTYPGRFTVEQYRESRNNHKSVAKANTWTDEYIVEVFSKIAKDNNLSKDEIPAFFNSSYLRDNNLFTPVMKKGGLFNLLNMVFPGMYTENEFFERKATRGKNRKTDNEVVTKIKSFLNDLGIKDRDIPLTVDSSILKGSTIAYMYRTRFNSSYFEMIDFAYPGVFKKESFIGSTKYRKEFSNCENFTDALEVSLSMNLPVPKLFYYNMTQYEFKATIKDILHEIFIKDIELGDIDAIIEKLNTPKFLTVLRPIFRKFNKGKKTKDWLKQMASDLVFKKTV